MWIGWIESNFKNPRFFYIFHLRELIIQSFVYRPLWTELGQNLWYHNIDFFLTIINFYLDINPPVDQGCVHAYFAKAESAFWNADSKRRSKTPLIQAIVRAQVNRKGVYMTSFKRGYNVILRSCFHQNQRFALTTIVNAHFWAAFMLILRRRFETVIQNADPKRRSKTPFTEVLFMLPSRRRRYVYRRRHVSEFSECLIQAIVRAQVNRKGVYMTFI